MRFVQNILRVRGRASQRIVGHFQLIDPATCCFIHASPLESFLLFNPIARLPRSYQVSLYGYLIIHDMKEQCK